MERLKFLIVDDSELILEMTKSQIEEFVDCDTASDGDIAVNMFKEKFGTDNAYDVILMDIEMPNMRGLDALRQIRSLEKEFRVEKSDKVKIIMVSALYKGNIVIESMLEYDADDYIVKPFSLRQLCKILDSFGITHGIIF